MVRNASDNVIGISEKNPHYFQYKGEEILLITSAEMYGAVINKKFDYIKYFDALHAYGLNYVRIYPGAFIEKTGMFLEDNNLAPGPDTIVPWARSATPGYIGGGNKFDLDKWDPEYFSRLRDFISSAAGRDIIVEVCFFNAQYPESYDYSPMYISSNVQGIGDCDYNSFQYMDHDRRLFDYQLKYIEKIIEETNEYDNVIYEFIDEPTLFEADSKRIFAWISALIDKAVEVEERLPKKHMLAQQLEFAVSFSDDDRVALIVTQYIEANKRQVGGIMALNNVYCYNKPIELNETALFPEWHQCLTAARIEAWEFMVGGGAAFNQLNGYFSVRNPAGNDAKNHVNLEMLKRLRTFMESIDYINMTRDLESVKSVTEAANLNMISEKGRQYAIYMHNSPLNCGKFHRTFYAANVGRFSPVITMELGKGGYEISFIQPETLDVIEKRVLNCDGGDIDIKCPEYMVDIAILINAVN